MDINPIFLKGMIEKVTDEYGEMHDKHCALNDEDGSNYGCDCWVEDMVQEIIKEITK